MRRCAQLVERRSREPVQLARLLDIVTLDVLAGHADAHAKNLSLLHCRVADVRAGHLARSLENGYSVEHGGKHLKVKNAEGATVYTLPTTPSGSVWKVRLLRDLEKRGLI